MSGANQTTTTKPTMGDAKKKKNGKAARRIGEVDVARGELGHDEQQTGVPTVSGHELRDKMQEAKEAERKFRTELNDVTRRLRQMQSLDGLEVNTDRTGRPSSPAGPRTGAEASGVGGMD